MEQAASTWQAFACWVLPLGVLGSGLVAGGLTPHDAPAAAPLRAAGSNFGPRELGRSATAAADQAQAPDTLRRRLQARQSVRWQQLELQQILDNQTWPGIAVWCDRRVDRSRVVDLELQQETIQTVIEKLAQACQASVVVLEDVVVLLPAGDSPRLPVVLADARRQVADLPAALRPPLLKAAARDWPRLAQPSDLWQAWLAAGSATALGDPLPHDVWDAGALPAMPLVDQLALLAFGFERRLVCQRAAGGLQIQLSPFSDDAEGEILIEDAHHLAELERLSAQWDSQFPNLRRSGKKPLRIAGTFGHLASLLDRLELNRPRAGTTAVAINRYTVKIEGQSAEEVIRFIAQQTQRTVTVADHLAGSEQAKNLATPIHLDVKDLPLEDLLQQIGKQAGLLVQLGQTQITVRPLPSSK